MADTGMEVKHYAQFDAPDLTPIIACEHTADGWRGLTGDGEILNVSAHVNGAPLPDSIAVVRAGETIGYRALPKSTTIGLIDIYQRHLEASSAFTRENEHAKALVEIDAALAIAPTMLARYNRGMILLALGRWQEGFDEWAHCERTSPLFMRPQFRAALDRGLRPWQGEEIKGKRLLLIHDHGYGDSIMTLRYLPRLRAMGAEVVLQVPPELRRLAVQCGRVSRELIDADFFCSLLMLMQTLHETPATVPLGTYLSVDERLRQEWQHRIGASKRKRIGIAWSVGVPHDDDYPRSVPLELLVKALGSEADLFSVQQQGAAEADKLGVEHFRFEDFADCAALMSLMDEVVTVDTAAVHLAGAIGHPCISVLLSHWSSWRWQSPLYRNVTICRQDSPGDWESAIAKRVKHNGPICPEDRGDPRGAITLKHD